MRADAGGTYEGAAAPVSLGDVAREWEALDAGAGLLRATWRRFFPATGQERLDFLHGQTSANVRALAAGQGCAGLVLTAQGRPLAIAAFYEDGERTWIATTAGQAAATRAALSRFLVADDCDFEDEVAAPCLTVAGPRAASVLVAAGAAQVAGLGAWGVLSSTIAGRPVTVFARGDLRVPCFDVLVGVAGVGPVDTAGTTAGEASKEAARGASGPASDDVAVGAPADAVGDEAAVAAALEAAGAVACGHEALEIVRIESGTARYGVDIDEGRLAMEARLEWAIHFAKGCYVGQEVVERAVSRGRINHELVLLAVEQEVSPGARVEGGSEADVVTSVARSPRLGLVALAFAPVARGKDGTQLLLLDGDRRVAATVLPWPRQRVLAGR